MECTADIRRSLGHTQNQYRYHKTRLLDMGVVAAQNGSFLGQQRFELAYQID